MENQPYIEQLLKESIEGLQDLCRGSLGANEGPPETLVAAVNSQVEVKGEHDFHRVPKACLDFLDALRESKDKDLGHVAAKILKSVRLAAYTHIVGKDAEYKDQPLIIDS